MKKIFLFSLIYLLAIPTMGQNSEYIDLGLSSGTLWKSVNEEDFYNHSTAMKKFGNQLPEKQHFVELKKECQWIWKDNYGYKVIGPNGNSILLPAAGSRSFNGDLTNVGTHGFYWSSTLDGSVQAWGLGIISNAVTIINYYTPSCLSVRLIQK
jgi:hypothetical protein